MSRTPEIYIMLIAFLITFLFIAFVYLVFFKFKWLKFSAGWGIVSFFFALHLFLIFVIGLRFVTPYSSNVKVVQHTIQLIPRLPEPTLVTAVLVKPDVPVKKGQPLFQFDRRPYEYQVRQLEAQLEAALAGAESAKYKVEQLKAGLAAANQDVRMYKADLAGAEQKVVRSKSELEYAKYQQHLSQGLAQKGAGPEEDAQKWQAQMNANEAAVLEATADAERARLKYQSQWEGVNTTVATASAQLKESEAAQKQATATVGALKAQLETARYYLDNTLMVAPEDGHIVNLQVQAGMVSGIYRVGGIAAFIVDSDRYLLASYTQETLKYVKVGQPVEFALDLYPGQVFEAKVDSIWWANGEGQYLPSDEIPKFYPAAPDQPQGLFAVKIYPKNASLVGLPIGAQGAAAIYTKPGAWAALRKITIRIHTWFNWLYPVPF
ncbi:MAG TPA: biotin/lipoyl-binding protein [Terriglobales bacterium]|nr:biotin/lipoyl-binding protein [Terriglobales bacterium]